MRRTGTVKDTSTTRYDSPAAFAWRARSSEHFAWCDTQKLSIHACEWGALSPLVAREEYWQFAMPTNKKNDGKPEPPCGGDRSRQSNEGRAIPTSVGFRCARKAASEATGGLRRFAHLLRDRLRCISIVGRATFGSQ